MLGERLIELPFRLHLQAGTVHQVVTALKEHFSAGNVIRNP